MDAAGWLLAIWRCILKEFCFPAASLTYYTKFTSPRMSGRE